MMTDEELNEHVLELEEYLKFMNDDFGDYISAMIELSKYRFFMSDELRDKLENELFYQLKYIKRNTKFVDKKYKFEQVVVELEWIDEVMDCNDK